MVKSSVSCHSLPTARDKRWPYDEYYHGDKDGDNRKTGQGEHHWTGAESLEWYIGPMLRDTMHGEGDYRWRHKDPNGAFVTYEGRFFANHLHGYGMMSYPEGRVFTGLFYNDARWGPGIERTTSLQINVGLWRGTRLARLCWRPPGPSVAPDLTTGPTGSAYLNPFRTVFKVNTKIIGETNSAIELLKHFGADPVQANEKWTKLYPKYCTDMNSALCYKDLFYRQYYRGKIHTLEETTEIPTVETNVQKTLKDKDSKEINNGNENEEIPFYYAWNNSAMMVHMMKHCYQHEQQRGHKLNLENILNGPRNKFRAPAKHEIDCRTLLMASYAGVIVNVTKLVNEEDVFPDIADEKGNTALIYAVCGDQTDVIHFLVEAGANVNAYNDSCCTPLGIALMRYTCIAMDVSPNMMVQALLPAKPEKNEPQTELLVMEWQIKREITDELITESKTDKGVNIKKSKLTKSSINKTEPATVSAQTRDYESDEDIYSNEKKGFLNVKGEYSEKILKQFTAKSTMNLQPLFTANDMMKSINAAEEEMRMVEKQVASNKQPTTKVAAPKKQPSKITKSKSIVQVETQKGSLTSYAKEKSEMLSKINLTILQLLTDGAEPRLVKCPKSAILLAVKSGSSDLVRHMVTYGADVNEKFPEFFNYTALDLLISEPFTDENLVMIQTLLELGADTRHRLKVAVDAPASTTNQGFEVLLAPGPTLLHAVVARKTESEHEEQIMRSIINLLLKYNADPTAQFRGRSPLECSMKKMELLDVFIKNSSTKLNAIINQQNHTILTKLLSRDFFKTLLGIDKLPTLTSLLLYGSDPLMECYDGDTRYENAFGFAKKVFNDISPAPAERKGSEQPIPEIKKGSKASKLKIVASGKSRVAVSLEDKKKDRETVEYKEVLNMMKDCARMLHIRWLQSKLLNELIDIIVRFKQRHWTMIIKEHKNANKLGLWVNASRCLEIWDILETTNLKKFSNENILRKLLRIVLFYQKRIRANKKITPSMTAVEKNIVETDVKLLMKEHQIASNLAKQAGAWKRTYVTPELDYKVHKKYKVCFECGIRLEENKITCDFCGLVSFCNLQCMILNFEKVNGHPCNELLMEKYSPPPEDDNLSNNHNHVHF